MFRLCVPAALAAAALAVASASEAAVRVTFTGAGGGAYGQEGGFATTYFPQQLNFINAITAFSSPFTFVFEYDPATVGVNNGGAATAFAATLVSGSIAGFTDFSAFTASVSLQAGFLPGQDDMTFALSRLDSTSGAIYTTDVGFTLVDNQGGLFTNTATLPGSIDVGGLEQRNSYFGIYRSGGSVGLGILSWSGQNIGVAAQVVGEPGEPVGNIPEPASWAMMITGFGLAGAALRRRAARTAA